MIFLTTTRNPKPLPANNTPEQRNRPLRALCRAAPLRPVWHNVGHLFSSSEPTWSGPRGRCSREGTRGAGADIEDRSLGGPPRAVGRGLVRCPPPRPLRREGRGTAPGLRVRLRLRRTCCPSATEGAPAQSIECFGCLGAHGRGCRYSGTFAALERTRCRGPFREGVTKWRREASVPSHRRTSR